MTRKKRSDIYYLDYICRNDTTVSFKTWESEKLALKLGASPAPRRLRVAKQKTIDMDTFNNINTDKQIYTIKLEFQGIKNLAEFLQDLNQLTDKWNNRFPEDLHYSEKLLSLQQKQRYINAINYINNQYYGTETKQFKRKS